MTPSAGIQLRLDAVVVAVTDEVPRLLVVPGTDPPELPCGALDVEGDRTLELALRRIAHQQTGIELGYVEQLYTFGDRDRAAHRRLISIAYLALVRQSQAAGAGRVAWRDLYALFPWEDRRREDHREGRPALLDATIEATLARWSDGDRARQTRAAIAFGLADTAWDPARSLERFELLYEVGLVAEQAASEQAASERAGAEPVGVPLALDHRRMAATALGRIRGKLSYRPVVFELLPPTFTLSQLQRVVEALAGIELHTPNFRRLLDRTRLVRATGEKEAKTGGRPAALYRFRHEVMRERPSPGVGLPR